MLEWKAPLLNLLVAFALITEGVVNTFNWNW
jgi:hypothetical protein